MKQGQVNTYKIVGETTKKNDIEIWSGLPVPGGRGYQCDAFQGPSQLLATPSSASKSKPTFLDQDGHPSSFSLDFGFLMPSSLITGLLLMLHPTLPLKLVMELILLLQWTFSLFPLSIESALRPRNVLRNEETP